jgi:nucleoside-diphosphate-sugar epimerase
MALIATHREPRMSHSGVRTIAVTGAAGAVGAQVVRQALAAGHRVIAIDKHSAAFSDTDGVDLRRGDLTLRTFCQEAVRGAQIIIHAAARNDPGQDYDTLAAINFDAVRWLYEAAQDAGAERFVALSAASLYKPSRALLNEDAPIEPNSTYTRTKAEAERYLRARPDGALPWTILRPSLVYGPGVRSFGASLLTLPPMLRQLFPYVPGVTGGPRNNWVHVEDLAAAALCVALHPNAAGQTYNVADDTFLSYGEILSAMIQAHGLDLGPSIPLPMGLLHNLSPFVDSEILFRALSRLLDPVWRRVQQRHRLDSPLQPTLHRAGLSYLLGDRMIGTERLKALGWRPKWPDLRLGMGDAVRWYQQHNWLPDYHALPDEDFTEEGIALSLDEQLEGRAAWKLPMPSDDDFCALDLEITFPSVRSLLVDQDALLEGHISLDQVAQRAPLRGTLTIHPIHRRLTYEFGFDGDDGASFRFRGEKQLTLLGHIRDFARLPGVAFNSRGQALAALDLHMDPRAGLAAMMRSLRLSFRSATNT